MAPFSLSPMTLNGTERPHSTDGHLVFGNEAHAARCEVLSRESRLDKLLDIGDEVLWQTGMRERNSGLEKNDYVVVRDTSISTVRTGPSRGMSGVRTLLKFSFLLSGHSTFSFDFGALT